jgi:hypothetical protein
VRRHGGPHYAERVWWRAVQPRLVPRREEHIEHPAVLAGDIGGAQRKDAGRGTVPCAGQRESARNGTMVGVAGPALRSSLSELGARMIESHEIPYTN